MMKEFSSEDEKEKNRVRKKNKEGKEKKNGKQLGR